MVFPAESRPSISMRTSCSLLHRIKEERDENSEDTERPIVRSCRTPDSAGGREARTDTGRIGQPASHGTMLPNAEYSSSWKLIFTT